jgi:cysteine desulfurase
LSGKAVQFELDRRGIAISTGSACSSGKKIPSPVLLAMGRSREQAEEGFRISIGKKTTKAEIDLLTDALREISMKAPKGSAHAAK